MSWTKGDLVDAAFEEIALSGDVFAVSPEERVSALKRLESMLATWEAKGVKIGYAFSDRPDAGDLTTDSGLIASANETVYASLALRIAGLFGKQVLPTTVKTATDGYATLLWATAFPAEQQLPGTMPRGAGNKPWRRTDRPFMPRPDPSPLANSDGGDLTIKE